MSKNKVFVLIDIRNEWVTWIVKHLRSPVALLDRCCRVPFWRKVGEISRRWQFCDMKNATKYLVVGNLGVLMTRRDISSLAVKGLKILSFDLYKNCYFHVHPNWIEKLFECIWQTFLFCNLCCILITFGDVSFFCENSYQFIDCFFYLFTIRIQVNSTIFTVILK